MNKHDATFRPVDRDDVAWLGNGPIPAKAYYDPAYFELERNAVFRRSWLHVGHVCELPAAGSFIRREMEVVNASVLIVRGKDDRIRAFHNVCTHRGTQLVDAESGRQSTFSCPYHRWTFDGEGSLLAAPDFAQFNIDAADCSLKRIALDTCGGLLFISFAETPPPLREWLGDLADQMDTLPVARATTFTEYVYEIDANWKLTYDNFQENYHLRFVHPKSGELGLAAQNPFGYPTHYGFHGQHRTQTIWSNPTPGAVTDTQMLSYARAAAATIAKGQPIAAGDAEYLALFPNSFIFATALAPFSHVVYPIDAGRSRGVIRLYWIGEDANASERFAREAMMASLRDIHSEDRNVILAGQKGLSSGALQHIHFQTQESLCRHFFNAVDAMVRDYTAETAA